MQDQIIKKIIHIFIAILITVLIATIIALLILKYNVEGEDNLPFELSKIMVISTAEGNDIEGEQTENKWNLKLSQNNDIYLEISKNKNYEETEIIDKIIIDNLQIVEAPKIGTIKLYKPTKKEKIAYENSEENEIKRASNEAYEFIEKKLDRENFKIFKPMPSPIDKIQNKYRWRIIIKGNMNEQANGIFNELLKELYDKNYKNTKITIDVNPNNIA